MKLKDLFINKWIASDIPRGLATGIASEYTEKNKPCIEITCGLAGGSLQFLSVNSVVCSVRVNINPALSKGGQD